MKSLNNLINRVWLIWSNFRFRKSLKNCEIESEDKFTGGDFVEWLKSKAAEVFSKFTYTADDVTQAFDAVRPPAQVYLEYVNGNLKDDCDGFHACVYHILDKQKGKLKLQDLCLFSIVPIQSIFSGHCLLAYKIDSKWGVVDYYNVFNFGAESFEQAADRYGKEVYLPRENLNGETAIFAFTFDYSLGKFMPKE